MSKLRLSPLSFKSHSPSQMRKRQNTEMSEPEPLFLPPKRLKSAVWEYFGYLKDPGGTINADGYPVCRMCRKKVSARTGNTSNMAHHLRDHHPKEFAKMNTLNLIASKDLADAVSKGQADPCCNQWSSEYYAINKLMSLTDSQLNELCEALGVPHFTPDETAYLTEYTDVFKPVAFALDLLHGEEKCFLGIVIPTLLTLKRKLEEKAANTRLFSKVIDSTVKAIDSRFKQVFESSDARLATATMPQFRLWWLPEDERESLRAQLITEVLQVDQGTEETETNGGSVHEDEFFSYGPGSSGNKGGKREAAEQVWLYLQGTNKDLKCLNEFPGVKKVFIKFNTTLPSSTPVQELFSNGSNIVTPKGHHLSDEHFERVLLLRYNSKITTALE
ncbi:hypothetical protein cypCar_00001369 [Cyprinus carpio]|nr:hypothetical protein cypCar_00001369 [Cyprinus carpio]